MKYLKKLLLFSLVLLFPILGISQMSLDDTLTEKGNNNDIYFLVKESFPEKKKGKLFLNETWLDGIITDYKNQTYKVPIRYRVYKEEMQIKHLKKTKALQIQQIQKVEFDEYTFIASEFILNEEKFMSFFEVVSDGKIQLLKQYNAKEIKDAFHLQSEYYSKKGKDAAVKINLKKKYILELMKDKKTEIQSYIKDHKINLKKSNDVEKLFDFYNTL